MWTGVRLTALRFLSDGLEQFMGKGIFAAFQDGLTHERTRPATVLGHLADTLSSGRDVFFDQGEIAEAMLRCGFRSIRSRTVETPAGAMDLDIARK